MTFFKCIRKQHEGISLKPLCFIGVMLKLLASALVCSHLWFTSVFLCSPAVSVQPLVLETSPSKCLLLFSCLSSVSSLTVAGFNCARWKCLTQLIIIFSYLCLCGNFKLCWGYELSIDMFLQLMMLLDAGSGVFKMIIHSSAQKCADDCCLGGERRYFY